MTKTKIEPVVGMPATYATGSDCYAGEITLVSPSGLIAVFTFANYRGHDRGGCKERFYKNKSGRYERSGGGGFLYLGEAIDYLDSY